MVRPQPWVFFAWLACPALAAQAQWVVFVEEPSRLSAPSELGAADPEEKDYAWGDLDNDGDIDLVVVRKQPFTTTGRRVNVLLMNEDGVLTDRTVEFATASDVAGDMGFLTATNDRDVEVVDLDGDGWLDLVTAVTLTDNAAKHLSHPRVYMNLGEIDGIWQGLRYEDARIPQMHPTAGPRFCAVSAGDVTGDGAPDLFFSDYDSGGAQIFDFNDRLLVNDGNGFFTDETTQRLAPEMYLSIFGISNAIVDMNGDGFNDIVRLTSNGDPYHVGIAYNNPANEGFFSLYDQVYSLSPYHTEVGDLNGDGLLDLVVLDDGTDRYLLNQGLDPQGQVVFSQVVFPPETGVINAGNVVIADFDKDGFNDVIVADVDVDIAGCDHPTFFFHNGADPPDVTFAQQDEVIPESMFSGVYDVGVFDIDGNGWLDLVVGRCSGTQVWMNYPPVNVAFSYPQGLPEFVDPALPVTFEVTLQAVGDSIEPGTPALHVSVNGGVFSESPLVLTGKDVYEATLPASACGDILEFYLSAELAGGQVFTDPPGAPDSTFSARAISEQQVVFFDDIEGDVSAWVVVNEPGLANGAWEQADPNGTIAGGGLVAPEDDATPDGTMAFVTQNGPPGGSHSADDVDGGYTYLVSPLLDLSGGDALVKYARWVVSLFGDPDPLEIEVSNDGGSNWTTVESVESTGAMWETVSFLVGDFVAPTAQVQVRFGICDCPNDSSTEAGIDDFTVTAVCQCLGDLDGNGAVGTADLLDLLSRWGTDPGGPPDFNGDGNVGTSDLLELLSSWGPCW